MMRAQSLGWTPTASTKRRSNWRVLSPALAARSETRTQPSLLTIRFAMLPTSEAIRRANARRSRIPIRQLGTLGERPAIAELLLHGGNHWTEDGSRVEVTVAQMVCRNPKQLIQPSRLEHDDEAVNQAMQLDLYPGVCLQANKDGLGRGNEIGLMRVADVDGITELEFEHRRCARWHRMDDGQIANASLALAIEADESIQPAGWR